MYSSSSKMYQPRKPESECFSPYIKILTELKEIKEYLRPSRIHGSEEQGIKSEFMYSEVDIQILCERSALSVLITQGTVTALENMHYMNIGSCTAYLIQE